MMQFAMARFTKRDTIFESMSKVHSQERIHRYNVMNFQFVRTTTYLTKMVVSIKALFLHLKPKVSIPSFATTSPAWVFHPSHIKSFFAKPVSLRISTLPSSSAIITAHCSFLRLEGLERLTALPTYFSGKPASFRLLLSLHCPRIDNTRTFSGAILLPIVVGLKRLLTFWADKIIQRWHTYIIAQLALVVKKFPNAPELKYEDVLVLVK